MQHVARVKNMSQQLKDVGEPVTNTTVMAKILAGLTSKYSAFQTVWDNVEEHQQTVENLTERLIREEARLAAGSETTEALAALKVTGAKKKTSGSWNKNGSKKDIECYKCKAKGHFARECPTKRKNKFRKEKRDESESRNCAFVIMDHEVVCNVDVGLSVEQESFAVGKDGTWFPDSVVSTEQARKLLAVDKEDA